MPCMGNGNDHCCYIKGKPCSFIITNYTDETGHFRKWACGLRAKHGNWDDVLADPRWIKEVKGSWISDLNCRDWPDALEGPNHGTCKDCGVNVEEIDIIKCGVNAEEIEVIKSAGINVEENEVLR